MMKEAESHADEDRRRREEIETRNRADQAVYAAERMLQDTGDKLAAADRQSIESAIQDVKSALDKNDAAAMTKAVEQLMAAQHKAAEALYRQSQTAGAGAPGGGGRPEGGAQASEGGAQSDVIDAEVVEEDKK